MTAALPHRYQVALTRTGPSNAAIEASPRPALAGGPPAEFDGDPHRWSPEHLLLSSIGLCLFTTFEALAPRASVTPAAWTAQVVGVLEKTPAGLVFTSFRVAVVITVPAAQVAAAETVLERAKRHCIVSNALRVPVEVEATFRSSDDAAA